MDDYLWYQQVQSSNPIQQGDFVYSCPILVPTSEMLESNGPIKTIIKRYNVIIMSQSCDLLYGKVDLVLVCPYTPLNKLEQDNEFLKGSKGKESLRQGYVPGYHLLNKCDLDGFENGHLVVDFRNVYGVPFTFLSNFVKQCGPRLRLLPPYREHLSQAFARFFMRVGLPIDIESFRKRTKPT